MSKNVKKDDWKLVNARVSAQKPTAMLLNNRMIKVKRVKRALGRYRFTAENSFQSGMSIILKIQRRFSNLAKLYQNVRLLEGL